MKKSTAGIILGLIFLFVFCTVCFFSSLTTNTLSNSKPNKYIYFVENPESFETYGTGDYLLEYSDVFSPSILHITHKGDSNFILHALDSDREISEHLINTIGNYDGLIISGIDNNPEVEYFEINADGKWTIQATQLSPEKMSKIPDDTNKYSGDGDDVLLIEKNYISATFITDSDSNFIVHSYSNNGKEFLINEIAPYSGTVVIQKNTNFITIHAEGSWDVQFND